jgi:hypothetical protein
MTADDWERREQGREEELNALLDAEVARKNKLNGYALTKEELRSLELPRPPDWVALFNKLNRLPKNPLDPSVWEAMACKLLLSLIDSDVPLSSPTRSFIARRLYDRCFPSSRARERHEHNQYLARQFDYEKRALRKKHPKRMSKATAERLIAEKYKLTVGAMRKRLQRAK